MNPTVAMLLTITKAWLGRITENPKGSNAGERVEALQRWCGGQKGDSWCAEAVYWFGTWASGATGKEWPLPRTASCEALRVFAEQKRVLHTVPALGDVYVLLDANGRAHHTGLVVGFPDKKSFTERSGNTSDPLQPPSREGFGFFEHNRQLGKQYAFISWQGLLL